MIHSNSRRDGFFENGDQFSAADASVAAQGNKNPRRKPPDESVSLSHVASTAEPTKLRHGAGIKISHPRKDSPSDTDISNNTKSTSSHLRSTPEDWYASWNTKVKDTNTTAFSDSDPPYYLGKNGRKISSSRLQRPDFHSQSSFPGSDDIPPPLIDFGLKLENKIIPQEASSDGDSFRSVIDDLTVKNQKLKKRLRKLERLHCNEHENDKLFEVRVHGLSRAKKRELDDILQKFALTINDSAPPDPKYQVSSGNGSSQFSKISMNPPSSRPGLNNSNINNTDSAYASESRISCTPPNPMLHQSRQIEPTLPKIKQSSSDTSERAKMKLVVKRLEQVFTGRKALESAMSRSQEQQAISNVATMDERSEKLADEELNEEEGPREAHLMSWQEDNEMMEHEADMKSVPSTTPPGAKASDGGVSLQRPTRPNDLDPQRSLLPVENVHYLESMTQSQHKLDSVNYFDYTNSYNMSSNWVYFNLITNLAQLHTLNVTVPFIKRSINTLSTKLELSPDGKKIRWKGGNVPTLLSSVGSKSASCEPSGSDESASDGALSARNDARMINSANSSGSVHNMMNRFKGRNSQVDNQYKNGLSSTQNTTGGSDCKEFSPDHAFSTGMSSQLKSPRQVMTEKFQYKPMCYGAFASFRGGKSDMETESDSDSVLSVASGTTGDQILINSTGDESGKSAQPKKNAQIDGPVIYFGGTFCIDLSAMVVLPDLDPVVDMKYKQYSEVPLGPERPHSRCSSVDRTDSPFSNAAKLSGQQQPSLIPDSDYGDMDCDLTDLGKNSYSFPDPVNLPASGLGGVQPEDNFMLHVITTHSRQKTPKVHIRHTISRSSLNAFFEEKPLSKRKHGHEILSLQNKKLEPSTLPSPSYGIFSSSSEESEELTTSESRNVSDSDVSYQFPIDLDSRSEGEEDIWKKHDNSMDIDHLESLMPMSSVATAGGSFYGGAQQMIDNKNGNCPCSRSMDQKVPLISTTTTNAPLSPRSLLKRSRSSTDTVSLQETKNVDEQKPPHKLGKLSSLEDEDV